MPQRYEPITLGVLDRAADDDEPAQGRLARCPRCERPFAERVPSHPATLDPFVSVLLHRGQGGQVVLVDAVTGAVVARRRVRPFAGKAGDRVRRRGD